MDYSCKICSKQFTQLRNLTRHEKISHGEKQAFVCEICDKSFTRGDALKRHQKQHERMLMHTCDKCEKQFYRRDKLVEHRALCQENSLKRKLNEDGGSPTPKKMRSEIQVGEGEPYDRNKEDENLENPCSSTGAFNDTLKKVELKPRKDQKHDMSNFLRGKTKSIYSHLTKNLEEKRGLKWFIGVKVRFVKHKPDGEDIFSEPHFRSLCVTTVHLHTLEEQVQQAKQKVTQSFVMYQKEGSGWVLDEVLHMDLSMAHYKPVKGSSYIPLPKILQHKKAVINIKNSDDKCFMWSILASLYILWDSEKNLREFITIGRTRMNLTLMELSFLLRLTKLRNSNVKTIFPLMCLVLRMCYIQFTLQSNDLTPTSTYCYILKHHHDTIA